MAFRYGTERENAMLRIYQVCLEIVEEVQPIADRIARRDRDLARQLRKASANAALNVCEGSGTRAGRRRNTYDIALGEAKETRGCLHLAVRARHVPSVDPELLDKVERVIATLINVVR